MVKQYKTIARIMENGKRVGFIFEVVDINGKKKKISMSDIKIKNLMNQGEIFDITFNNRGFLFKDKNKTLSELPIKNKRKQVQLDKKIKHKIIIEEYTGNELRKYVTGSEVIYFKQRDFVNAIGEYCKSNISRVLSISGLRGTGKTTGIKQAILNLSKYDDTVFISIDELANMDCLDLRNLLINKYKNKKYIFIDEITRIKDLINNSGFLADLLCSNGKKVIISGTDSLGLIKSESAGLYHRMLDINVTHISYTEAQRTMNQTLAEYMQIGGLYTDDAVKNIDELRRYVDTAVVDNITTTLTKNKGTTALLGLHGINDKSKLRTLVFRIIYAIIYCNMQKIKTTSVMYLINMFDVSTSSLYDTKLLNKLVCSQMLIDEVVNTNQTEVQSLLTAMEEIGLLVKARNICNKTEINYYITNPSIVNQLIGSILSILEKTNLNKIPNATVKGMRGHLFESIVVVHTKKVADKLGYELYYYHDVNNREIDLIIEKETSDGFDDLYLYYEIKMTKDVDTAVVKSAWINDSNIPAYGIVVGKGIIYGGKNEIFKGFKNSDTYPTRGMTLEQIENQNMGIKLISADDYLLNTLDKLKVLETYEIP